MSNEVVECTMVKTQIYTNNQLTLEVQEHRDTINVKWTGKSIDRNPAEFLTPILVRVVKKSSDQSKRIVFDFKELSYMNSSTITPIIKILERGRRGTTPITVQYDDNKRWQDLSFSALKIFGTKDGRIEIVT